MFKPDFRNIIDVASNRKPARLPLYEHIIAPEVMEKILDVKFAGLIDGDKKDLNEFFSHYCRFWKEMTYDTVSFEVCITDILPGHGAIFGGKPGPVQSRSDYESYPWSEIPELFWKKAAPQFDALRENMSQGMKAIGGVGNGVFEISEDIVGFEQLVYMKMDDQELFNDVYNRIGETMHTIWAEFLKRYGDDFAVCRFGDDLGFKTSLLTSPEVVRENIIPQYKRLVDLIHSHDKPFLWHSCGCIFEIIEDVLAIGIDAKHSNEDAICKYDKWIEDYSDRIGLFGGIDTDRLCRMKPDEVYEFVLEEGTRFRSKANGYALGSGNSIPDYVPHDAYLAMVKAVQEIRRREG